MIAFLEGVIAYAEGDHVVLNVGGVGYRVFVTGTTAYQAKTQEGQSMRLYTFYNVREDAHLLFGFATRSERDLFARLNEVSGIGPKVALAIMGAGAPDQVIWAIRAEDVTFLTKLPGVGKKTAQRLILDLKDKLEDMAASFTPTAYSLEAPAAPARAMTVGLGTELHEALLTLGYNEKEAQGAVRSLASEIDSGVPVEQLIKLALKQLMRQ